MLSLCRPLSRRVLRWRKPCLCCLSRHPTVAGNGVVSEKLWLSSPKRQRFLPSHHARDPRLSTPSPWAHCWTSPTHPTRAKQVEVKWMIRHVMWLKRTNNITLPLSSLVKQMDRIFLKTFSKKNNNIALIGCLKSLQKFPLHYVRVLFQNSLGFDLWGPGWSQARLRWTRTRSGFVLDEWGSCLFAELRCRRSSGRRRSARQRRSEREWPLQRTSTPVCRQENQTGDIHTTLAQGVGLM